VTEQAGGGGFGRVDDDGTVYVRTRAGERKVGQWPGGDPDAALAFYRTRFEGLAVEVDLLEQRIRAGALAPDEAAATIAKVRGNLATAQAVGDLDGLCRRLDELGPLIEQRREERRAERAAKADEARRSKERIAAEAERIASSSDWRNGATRLRELLDTWKALPRIDRPTDDELWHRFSSARTTYTRRRKQHFSELSVVREQARAQKEKLVAEAEELSSSTDWAGTSRAFRDLMKRWKAAGSAQKDVDDVLWQRFRSAQDAFFGARDAANAAVDQQYAANAEVKRGILAAAERLLPVTDPKAARETFRGFAERWDAAGKVPKDDMVDLEARFRRVEQAVRGAEDDRWRRSNPEAHARASATASQLEALITSLEKQLTEAETAGDGPRAEQVRADLAARRSWLTQTRKTLTEFT
jgi:Domain of Unknown Function (DUF349)